MKWCNKGHEFDEIAEKICQDKIKFYIWGNGVIGKSFYNDFKDKIDIIAFIDSDENKQGVSSEGYKVISPDELYIHNDEMVLIATGWITEVVGVLNAKGYQLYENYVHVEFFSSIYMLYKYDKIYVEKIDLDINTLCTLKCKHCVSLIPYVNGKNDDFNLIKANVDRFFEWVDYVHVFGISGGDAMLNPNLSELIRYLGTKYQNRYEDIELYTNAVILPDDEMLLLWKQYDIIVRFTDYRKNVGKKQKINEMKRVLDHNGLRYDHVKFEKWVDIGYPQESNGIMTENGLVAHCEACSPVICSCLKDEKIFYCSPAAAAYASHLFENEENDSFDLSSTSENRKKEFIEYYLGYSEKGYMSYCKRCNGLFNNNHNFIDVAEQL